MSVTPALGNPLACEHYTQIKNKIELLQMEVSWQDQSRATTGVGLGAIFWWEEKRTAC